MKKEKKTPITILRKGIVLSEKGGALEKMKMSIILPLGSEKQYLPWIHIDDLCQLYIKTIEENLIGIYNAVAPEYQTSVSFSRSLARSIKRPYLEIAVPSFILKFLFGEMAIILLEENRILTKKSKRMSFLFDLKHLKKC